MESQTLIINLSIGLLLGVVGQAVRSVAGLKKQPPLISRFRASIPPS